MSVSMLIELEYTDLLKGVPQLHNVMPRDWMVQCIYTAFVQELEARRRVPKPPGAHTFNCVRALVFDDAPIRPRVFRIPNNIPVIPAARTSSDVRIIEGRRVHPLSVRVVSYPNTVAEMFYDLCTVYRNGEWSAFYETDGNITDPVTKLSKYM